MHTKLIPSFSMSVKVQWLSSSRTCSHRETNVTYLWIYVVNRNLIKLEQHCRKNWWSKADNSFLHTALNSLACVVWLYLWASQVAQKVKNLPAVQESWVWLLGQEDPLEKEMATHSSILVWRIPWTQEPGGLQSIGSQRVGQDWSDLARTHAINAFSKVVQFEVNTWVNPLSHSQSHILTMNMRKPKV